MNRNQLILLLIAIFSFPLIYLFIPDSQPGSLSSLVGVTLSNFSGQKFRLAGQFTEKPLLLVFWSVTCGTCIEEIPFIIRLNEEFKNKMTIVGIHPPGYPAAKIQRFVKKFPQKIPYMLVVGDQEMSSGQVAPRQRGGDNLGAMPVASFIALVQEKCGQYL